MSVIFPSLIYNQNKFIQILFSSTTSNKGCSSSDDDGSYLTCFDLRIFITFPFL